MDCYEARYTFTIISVTILVVMFSAYIYHARRLYRQGLDILVKQRELETEIALAKKEIAKTVNGKEV